MGKTFLGRCIYKLFGNAVYNIKGYKFELHIFSFIDRMLIEKEQYEDDIFDFIKSHLKEGGIFLDIGANFGLFSIQAASLSNVNVFSFEPSKRELLRLNHNILINKLCNITVFPFALSNENSIAQLNIHDDENQGMNSLLNSFESNIKENVKCYPLDNLLSNDIAKEVKIIKIDVEGFEYNVLKGMSIFLDTYYGPIILEITYSLENIGLLNYNPDDIYDLLYAKGYTSKYGKRYASQYNDFFKKS